MARIAFIGLGHMGGGMAPNLVKAGHDVRAFDLVPEAVQHATEGGCSAAASAAEAVKDADVVITMLPAAKHVRAVFHDDIAPNARPGTLLIDCSTIDVASAREVGEGLKGLGFDFLDAPVSGGQAGAVNGVLTVMIGGDQAPYDRAKPVIDSFARMATLIGPSGSGQLTKMVNQAIVAITVQGVSEGLAFAQKAGLDIPKVMETISKGAAQSWQMENRWKTMNEGKFDFGFAVEWMRKDLSICLAEARRNGASLPVTALVDAFYSEVEKMGGKRWDTSSLLARLER